ncbi:hypothetical protein [Gemmata sp.]|uniref:hypothetical protein n=1 Tax=Gemmata sp. TaxID=1914242 RepID=UPI003F72C230
MAMQRGKCLGTRLAHLEARVPAPSIEVTGPRTEDEWLAAFGDMGRDGFFAPEPEFPEALALFHDAVAAGPRLGRPAPGVEPCAPSPH